MMMYSGLSLFVLLSGINMISGKQDNRYDSGKIDSFYKSQKDYGLKDHRGDYNKLDEYLSFFDDNMEICGSSNYYKWDDDKYCHNKQEYKYWLQNKYNGYYKNIDTNFQIIDIDVVIIIIDIDFIFIDDFGCTFKEWELVEISYDSYGKINKYEIKDSKYDDSYHCDRNRYDGYDGYNGHNGYNPDRYYDDKYDDKNYHDDKKYDDKYDGDKKYDGKDYHDDKKYDDKYYDDKDYHDDKKYDDKKYDDKYNEYKSGESRKVIDRLSKSYDNKGGDNYHKDSSWKK